MIGKNISPILVEIEDVLLGFEVEIGTKPEYTDSGFRAAIKIFMSVLMDKMWELQLNEKILMEDRMKMAHKLGQDVRQMIKTYTDIDTHELYKTGINESKKI